MYIAKFNLNGFKNTPTSIKLKKTYKMQVKWAAECIFTLPKVVLISSTELFTQLTKFINNNIIKIKESLQNHKHTSKYFFFLPNYTTSFLTHSLNRIVID